MRAKEGAVGIFKDESDFVDSVGTSERGNYVLVPWEKGWWYFCHGATRVAHIEKK